MVGQFNIVGKHGLATKTSIKLYQKVQLPHGTCLSMFLPVWTCSTHGHATFFVKNAGGLIKLLINLLSALTTLKH